MDLARLLSDRSIPHSVTAARGGWIELRCVWCDDHGSNLGWSLSGEFFNCWRCGGHGTIDTVARLVRIEREDARRIILDQYGGFARREKTDLPETTINQSVRTGGKRKPLRLPSGTRELGKTHRRYLEARGFDPDRLVRLWEIRGTGPVATLDGINYSHRLVIPIEWDGRRVSFQTRDITGRHPIRYLASPLAREIVPHKTILYGREDSWSEDVICTEGVTDVWRFGPRAFATFGVKVTTNQVRAIARQRFRSVHVVFDFDDAGREAAHRLVARLRLHGIEARAFDPPPEVRRVASDPGSLPPRLAREIVQDITGSVS